MCITSYPPKTLEGLPTETSEGNKRGKYLCSRVLLPEGAEK